MGERIAFNNIGKGLIEAGVFAVKEEILLEIRFDAGIGFIGQIGGTGGIWLSCALRKLWRMPAIGFVGGRYSAKG